MKRFVTLGLMCLAMSVDIPSFADQKVKKTMFSFTENFDNALELAQAHDMPLVLIFTAKDWCNFSQKLYDKILMAPEFAEEVHKKFVFVTVDFKDEGVLQREKLLEQHIALKKRFAIQDFPQIVLLDPKGLEIAKLGYSEEIPMEYGKRLVSLWNKYRGLEKEIAVPKRLSFEKIKEIFIEAQEMGAPALLSQLIELGLKIDKDNFFLIEAYRHGDIETKKKLRDKIASMALEEKEKTLVCCDLIDYSEASGIEKEKILKELREKIQSMKDKGLDISKMWTHIDGLLDQELVR